MKVIFLDVDGVLSLPSGSMISLNKKRIKLLSLIIEATSAKIVISSTWRTDNKYYQRLHRHFSYRQLKIFDCTPILHRARGEEIKFWLDNHPEVSKYVIIDDINTMLPEQQEYFLQTSADIGLTHEIVDKCINLLNS